MLEMLEYSQTELEWTLSYIISMWSFRHGMPLKSIKVKDSKVDNVFDNPGYDCHMVEIELV